MNLRQEVIGKLGREAREEFVFRHDGKVGFLSEAFQFQLKLLSSELMKTMIVVPLSLVLPLQADHVAKLNAFWADDLCSMKKEKWDQLKS